MTRPWGCHNRAPLHRTALVQDGWTRTGTTRLPRMVRVPDPMAKDCQYTLTAPTDPRCSGCRWQRVP